MPRGPSKRRAVSVAALLGLLPLLLVGGGCGDRGDMTSSAPTYDSSGRPLRGLKQSDRAPNLVLIVIDTLRHDALAFEEGTGATRPDRMPHLAALASRGAAFTNAIAPAPWTLPSMTSLLTGLQPSAHGLTCPKSRVQLVDAITTSAEVLRGAYGYDTVAFTAGPWFVGSGESILQGFVDRQSQFSLRDARSRIGQWARYRDPHRPFFLLLHTFDAHDPYGEVNHPRRDGPLPDVRADPALYGPEADPAEIFRRCSLDAGTVMALRDALGPAELAGLLHRYANTGYAADPRPDLAAELETAYWGGVRWADGLLAETTAYLGRAGLLENTLLVVTSDHGEGFGEHASLAHGRQLYDELVRVPLVMVGPEPFGGGRVLTSSVALVDVMPTFFDWAGLEPMRGIEGRSMLPLFEDDFHCRAVISEERLGFLNTGEPRDAIRASARTESWKYVVTYDLQAGTAQEEVYDLLIDPDEQDDLAGGTGRLPDGLIFDDCFCEAVESIRNRIWDDAVAGRDEASHVPYGAWNRQPATRHPAPCGVGTE